MNKQLNVFIDTSIFYNNGFSVDRTMFNTLRSLCDAKKINMLSTDITQDEIKANIEESIKELKTEFKRIASKNRIIETIGGDGYREFIDSKSIQSISNDIKGKIDNFLNYCNTTIIKASEQSAQKVLIDYFTKQPPFGEGKKKYEFPDAFILNALKDWCFKNKIKIIAISADKDFEKFCKNESQFQYFPSLYEFVDYVLMDQDNVVAVIHDIIKQNDKIIQKEIESEIENLGVYLGDAEGEVIFNDIMNFSILESSVVHLEGNTANIVCQVDTTLSFDANYWDPDSWMSVKDDGVKEIIYHHRIEGEVTREFNIEVEFEIKFDPKKSKIIEINNVVVNSGADLEYNHYEYDDYY